MSSAPSMVGIAHPTSPCSSSRLLAPQLRAVHVGLREDLEVSRHLFRGEPYYIVRDPMTFQSQRLSLADYEVLTRIDPGRSLSEIFDELVLQGKMSPDDEERFYRLVMTLHGVGFLRLPISDDKLLYRRYLMRQQARRRERLRGFLFLRIPLWNPDAFLDRTIHLVRPIFGRTFFICWILLVASACYVAAKHWDELVQPLQGVLVARNLPLMWFTLIGLKLFHEMGHAYACKHYGGHVPEMGAFLVVFTPCAYMDASASWGFARKRERMIVCLAGMYFEAIIAAVAVFVWALAEESLVKSIAYNVIFLASVVTVLFNINPLMRYDGYYIFSDLVEVPNLRQRSSRYVLGVLKRALLGIRAVPESGGRRLHAVLLGYGTAATTYRVFLILAITAILVTKMLFVGVVLGGLFLGGFVVANVRKLTKYLWYAEETAPVRRRAVAVGLVALMFVPAGLVFVPLPSHIQVPALVTREHETVVRAASPGFLEQVSVECGHVVSPGETLAELVNDSIIEEIAHAKAGLKMSEIRRQAFRVHEPVRALQEQAGALAHQKVLQGARAKLEDLHLRAPRAGEVVQCVRDVDIGSYLVEGSPVATIVAGYWQVRALLTEDQIARVRPHVGERVAFRAASCPSRTVEGVVAGIASAGSRNIELQPLTHLGGGGVVVDPLTHEAARPYFQVTIRLTGDGDGPGSQTEGVVTAHLRHGMTGWVRFAAGAEPIAKTLGRRFLRFWNRLLEH